MASPSRTLLVDDDPPWIAARRRDLETFLVALTADALVATSARRVRGSRTLAQISQTRPAKCAAGMRYAAWHEHERRELLPIPGLPAIYIGFAPAAACAYIAVMAAPHRPREAVFADLEALGDDVSAEIIRGAIVEKASPTMEHGRSQLTVGRVLGRRFDRRPGGRWPGGWWFGTEVDVEYDTHELFRHDLVGWRRERVPACPRGRPIRARPDWVCEMLSPSNEKRDLIDKLRVLHLAGVPHYWIGNPEERTLIVHRWEPNGYLIALAAAADDIVRAEPFEAIELRIDVMFGDADDED